MISIYLHSAIFMIELKKKAALKWTRYIIVYDLEYNNMIGIIQLMNSENLLRHSPSDIFKLGQINDIKYLFNVLS